MPNLPTCDAHFCLQLAMLQSLFEEEKALKVTCPKHLTLLLRSASSSVVCAAVQESVRAKIVLNANRNEGKESYVQLWCRLGGRVGCGEVASKALAVLKLFSTEQISVGFWHFEIVDHLLSFCSNI